jgi:hypothetical protein
MVPYSRFLERQELRRTIASVVPPSISAPDIAVTALPEAVKIVPQPLVVPHD